MARSNSSPDIASMNIKSNDHICNTTNNNNNTFMPAPLARVDVEVGRVELHGVGVGQVPEKGVLAGPGLGALVVVILRGGNSSLIINNIMSNNATMTSLILVVAEEEAAPPGGVAVAVNVKMQVATLGPGREQGLQ